MLKNPKITFRSGKKIKKIEINENNNIKVKYKRDEIEYDYAILCNNMIEN